MTPKFLMTRRAPVWLISFMLAFAAVGLVQAQPVAASETPMAAASTAIAVPPMAAPLLTPPASESLANPYGMRSVWQQGDPVARTTLLLLALMSLLSWYFIIAKLLAQGRLSAQAQAAKKEIGRASCRERV